MPSYICVTCGVQYPASENAPDALRSAQIILLLRDSGNEENEPKSES